MNRYKHVNIFVLFLFLIRVHEMKKNAQIASHRTSKHRSLSLPLLITHYTVRAISESRLFN